MIICQVAMNLGELYDTKGKGGGKKMACSARGLGRKCENKG